MYTVIFIPVRPWYPFCQAWFFQSLGRCENWKSWRSNDTRNWRRPLPHRSVVSVGRDPHDKLKWSGKLNR